MQQSCLSEEVFGGILPYGEPRDGELCIGQASSVPVVELLLAFAGIDAAFVLGLEACAAIGNTADVAA